MSDEVRNPVLITIPLLKIEQIYGPDGLDMAVDDLVIALSQSTGISTPDVIIEVDQSHADRRQHTLQMSIRGLTQRASDTFEGHRQRLQLGETQCR